MTLELDTDLAFTAPMVTTKVIDVKPPDTAAERIIQIAGVLTKKGKSGQIQRPAKVYAKEAAMTALVDENGSYMFRSINPGKHTFQVVIGNEIIKDIAVTIPSDSYDLEI